MRTITNPLTGEQIVFDRTAVETGGRLLSFELRLAAGGHVPASHVHPEQEERFTVMEGRMRFRRGLRILVAEPGMTVVVPPGTVHRFANAGKGPVRAHVEVRPALRMQELLEVSADLARSGRTLWNGMPRPLDFALFLREFEREIAVPFVPAALVRGVAAPLSSLAVRRGLDAPYRLRRIAAA
jgi:mannose-6-phosphate isomerase-like protein (cupin superfamily)